MANPNIVAVTSILGGNAGWNLSATATDTLMTVGADVIVNPQYVRTNTSNLFICTEECTVTGYKGTLSAFE